VGIPETLQRVREKGGSVACRQLVLAETAGRGLSHGRHRKKRARGKTFRVAPNSGEREKNRYKERRATSESGNPQGDDKRISVKNQCGKTRAEAVRGNEGS